MKCLGKCMSIMLSMILIVMGTIITVRAEESGFEAMSDSQAIPNIEEHMLYYYFNDDGFYEVSYSQFQEISATGDLEAVVHRDGLEPIDCEENSDREIQSRDDEVVPGRSRKAGSWDITSNDILPGYKVTYSMPNGASFLVAPGESVTCQIGPNRACWLTVGASGTKNYEKTVYVDFLNYYGITVGTTTEGSYKFYAANYDNDFTVTVSGIVRVM